MTKVMKAKQAIMRHVNPHAHEGFSYAIFDGTPRYFVAFFCEVDSYEIRKYIDREVG